MPVRKLWAALLASAAAWSAAPPKVGPNYQPPAVSVPSQFESAPTGGLVQDEQALESYWTMLGDAELNSLIQRAAAANLDLKLAAQRLLEARAAHRVARSDLQPSVGTVDTVQRIRGGFNQGIVHLPGPGSSPALISPFETNVFQLGFDASWEIDFFGGKRRAIEAANAEVRAADESRHDVLVTLLAEVARSYIELRGAQRHLALTRQNIDLQEDTLHLAEVRAEAGLGTHLDLERQKTLLESTRAQIPSLQLAITQRIHSIGTLLNLPPAALTAELSTAAPLPAEPPQIPAGLPADLLKRRPDIRRSEAGIAAATARVGVARSDFFPKITLTGTAGRQSADFPGFTLGAGNFFSLGPGVRLPLFTGGRLKANLDIRKHQLDEALTIYQNTVLTGLREAEDSLSAYERERERRRSLKQSVLSSEETVKLARDLYLSGLTSFLDVLDAQRQQLSAETDLTLSETVTLTNLIAIYKALGGGWTP